MTEQPVTIRRIQCNVDTAMMHLVRAVHAKNPELRAAELACANFKLSRAIELLNSVKKSSIETGYTEHL
jgi:hypothetical protein